MHQPPGTEEIQHFFPKLRYELIGCGLHGHELLGTHTKTIRTQDSLVVRELNGIRWYRCLRCDSWLPLPKPEHTTQDHLPDLHTIEPPLRGRALRNRYVLRLIAVDRAFHVLILSFLAVGVFLFASHRANLQHTYSTLMNALQQASGGGTQFDSLVKLHSLFNLSSGRVLLIGLLVAAYAALEAVEMVGLWLAKRWAEYLTFIATILFIPYEVYEMYHRLTWLKIVTFIINVAIAVYLLYAKRLFGLRGGGKVEAREIAAESGWQAIERATPR